MSLTTFVKKHIWLANIYRKIRNTFLIPLAYSFPFFISKYKYKSVFHRKCNLKSPHYFNEILMKIKLEDYNNNELISKCADKFKVREYVKEKGCEEILNELLGVYENVNQIDWNILPNRFALKCNHASGYNIICTDKNKLDITKTKRQLKFWMSMSCGAESAELHYMHIKRKIIAEKYLETNAGIFPLDYRFYCTYGEVKTCLLMHYSNETIENHKSYHIFVDLDYNPIDISDTMKEINYLTPKPSCWNDMLHYAKILSKDFPFVRVDLYDYNNHVLFGELTFTPVGCLGKYNESPVLDDLFKNLRTWNKK